MNVENGREQLAESKLIRLLLSVTKKPRWPVGHEGEEVSGEWKVDPGFQPEENFPVNVTHFCLVHNISPLLPSA